MSDRKYFYFIFSLCVLGLLICWIYFWPRETKTVLPLTPVLPAPEGVHFEPEKILVPPPDYGANLEKPQNQQDNSETAPIIPQTEEQPKIISMRIVGYRGVIAKISGFNLEFKPAVEGKDDSVAAALNEKTQITQVILGEEAVRTTISLQDLQIGDEILISGLSRDYYQPIVNTTHIERFYTK